MTLTWQSAETLRERQRAQWYEAGHRAGVLDRSIGVRSEYTLNARVDGGYPGAYGTGYYDALVVGLHNNPWRAK